MTAQLIDGKAFAAKAVEAGAVAVISVLLLTV